MTYKRLVKWTWVGGIKLLVRRSKDAMDSFTVQYEKHIVSYEDLPDEQE